MNTATDNEIIARIVNLWTIEKPVPENPYVDEDIKALVESYQTKFGIAKHLFQAAPMTYALRTLGCPRLTGFKPSALSVPDVKARLDDAYSGAPFMVTHMCPLDLFDWLPDISTDSGATITRLSKADLERILQTDRHRAFSPDLMIDSERLSYFHWLIVEESISPNTSPASRGGFALFDEPMNADHGKIEPHKSRYPAAMEEAIFCMLLAPWEDWTGNDYDWRGFEVPFVYTVSADLLSKPAKPPTADILSLEDAHQPDDFGNFEFVGEQAVRLTLEVQTDYAAKEITSISNAFNAVKASPLFGTPVVHLFVRAFLASGIDEYVYHMLAIEAAIGAHSDYYPKLRPKPDPHNKTFPRAMDRMKRRLDQLIGAGNGDVYEELFDLRSKFLHGRGGMDAISWKDRLAARKMAREVICALVQQARTCTTTREDFLNGLL